MTFNKHKMVAHWIFSHSLLFSIAAIQTLYTTQHTSTHIHALSSYLIVSICMKKYNQIVEIIHISHFAKVHNFDLFCGTYDVFVGCCRLLLTVFVVEKIETYQMRERAAEKRSQY